MAGTAGTALRAPYLALLIALLLLFKLFKVDILHSKTPIQDDVSSLSALITSTKPKCSYYRTCTRFFTTRISYYPQSTSTFQLNNLVFSGDISPNPGPANNSTRSCNSDGLNILYINARSLKAFVASSDNGGTKVCKIQLLQQLVFSSSYDVVCVCETWLNDSILSSEILPGYTIYRRDRLNRTGGGVLVAVKDNIRSTRHAELEPENTELIVIELIIPNSKSVLLYTFYRPPNSAPDVLLQLNSSLLSTRESSCCILLGDFNLPELDWSNPSAPNHHSGQVFYDTFCDLAGDNFLHQLIEGPTHIAGNKLDLLLCNCPEYIEHINTFKTDDFPTDHLFVEFSIKLKFRRAKPVKRRVFDYKNGDFEGLRSTLSHTPFNLCVTDDINDHWSAWKDLFLAAVKEHIPTKTITDKNTPPWIDKDVRHLIHKKYTILKKYRQNKSEERKRKLRVISQNIKTLMKNKHREYLDKIESSFKSNSKAFWSYHKAVLHHRASHNAVLKYNGTIAKSSKEKAELFNLYFSSVFSTPDVNTNYDNEINSPETVTSLAEFEICVDEVNECLSNLDTSKACGPDGIPARLLKECSQQIAPSLCALFNTSLGHGRLPSEWKSADVSPIHKKDSKELAENYRPISLLPIIGKIIERCVAKRLYDHLIDFISPLQHGFLKNRSCTTQLVQVLHTLGQNLDKNIQTDVIYLDFSKAFDSVDHRIILSKLKSHGVEGRCLDWFSDYLTDRTQRVVVDGVASNWSHVTSGVPQGSILGPLLFVLFINDLPDTIPTDIYVALYADDTKAYNSVKSEDDAQHLQQALSSLDNWSTRNNLKFNESKCKVLTITRKKHPICFNYKLGSTELLKVNEEKDLGVTVTDTLSWNPHIQNIVSNANKLLGLLKRTCPLLPDVNVRRTLYLSIVKSQLSYATVVWSPHHIYLKLKTERVQRRATRWILKERLHESSYKERLIKLNMLPLCYDREIKDLIFFYNCLYGISPIDVNNFVNFIPHNRTRNCFNPEILLKTQSCKTSLFKASYFNRITKLWNIMCKVAPPFSLGTLSSFKNFVTNHYFNLLANVFDIDQPCTWSAFIDCSCHRTHSH